MKVLFTICGYARLPSGIEILAMKEQKLKAAVEKNDKPAKKYFTYDKQRKWYPE